MSAGPLLVLGLLALLLPHGTGCASLLAAPAARASPPARAGLLLLALAAFVRDGPPATLDARTSSHLSGAQAAPPPGDEDVAPGAVRLVGRWRAPPGGAPHLATAAGPVVVAWSESLFPPPPGTEVRLSARLSASGAATVMRCETRGPPAGAWLDRWLVLARERVATLVGPGDRALVEALVLGVRDELSFESREACRVSGLSHLLALSGLHVVLVAGVLQRTAGAVVGPQRRGVQGVLLLLFVALAGARAPLARALLAWTLALFAERWGRGGRPLHRLGSVALLLAAAVPAWVDDLGARLSFLAVGGLLALLGTLRATPASVLAGTLAPCGAFLTTAPLVVETFGEVQPAGLLWTPLVVPLVGAVLALGMLLVVPGTLFAALDGALGPVLDALAHALHEALRLAAHLSPEPLRPPPLPLPGSAAGLALVAALAVLAHALRRRAPP